MIKTIFKQEIIIKPQTFKQNIKIELNKNVN